MNEFVKSSYSRDDCVAVRRTAVVAVADSKEDFRTVLTASPDAWGAFLEGLDNGLPQAH